MQIAPNRKSDRGRPRARSTGADSKSGFSLFPVNVARAKGALVITVCIVHAHVEQHTHDRLCIRNTTTANPVPTHSHSCVSHIRWLRWLIYSSTSSSSSTWNRNDSTLPPKRPVMNRETLRLICTQMHTETLRSAVCVQFKHDECGRGGESIVSPSLCLRFGEH